MTQHHTAIRVLLRALHPADPGCKGVLEAAAARTRQSTLRRSLLLGGLSWISGISFLSADVGLAQTTPEDTGGVPSAQDLLPAPASVPVAHPPAAPETVPLQSSASEAIVPAAQPNAIEPAALPIQTTPAIEPAALPIQTAPIQTAPVRETIPPSSNEGYIDTTDYSIGATQSLDQPAVVLSERSTGCQVVLQRGQGVPASLCASSRPPVASLPAVGVAQARSVRPARSMAIGTVQSSVNGRRTGGIAPLARNFYNLTRRPAARLGNGNISPLFPLSIPAAITSAFGWRIHPISGDYRFHSGTDMGAPMGTPVLAAYAGRVSIADFMRGYGLTVVMQHNSQHHPQHAATAQTLYAHLSELFVQSGEWVEQGEVIGRVGSTGNSTGPHLHFEFRELTPQGWQALDPGQMLEYSLAQLIQSLQTAQAVPLPQPPEQPVRVQPEAPIDRALSQRQHRNQDRNA